MDVVSTLQHTNSNKYGTTLCTYNRLVSLDLLSSNWTVEFAKRTGVVQANPHHLRIELGTTLLRSAVEKTFDTVGKNSLFIIAGSLCTSLHKSA